MQVIYDINLYLLSKHLTPSLGGEVV